MLSGRTIYIFWSDIMESRVVVDQYKADNYDIVYHIEFKDSK